MFDELYWRGEPPNWPRESPHLTLKQFEAKYRDSIIAFAEERFHSNVRRQWQDLLHQNRLLNSARPCATLDELVNVHWPLSHYRSAVRHLQKDPVDIAATGGTNWQQYLPPRFQKLIFFPELWSPEQEQAEWGKRWVLAEHWPQVSPLQALKAAPRQNFFCSRPFKDPRHSKFAPPSSMHNAVHIHFGSSAPDCNGSADSVWLRTD